MMKDWETIRNLLLEHAPWLLQILGIMVLAYFLHAFSNKLLRKLISRKVDSSAFGHAFIKSAIKPVRLLIVLLLIHAILNIINGHYPIVFIKDAIKFLPAFYIVITSWFFFRLKNKLLPKYSKQSTMINPSTADSLDKLITSVIIILAALMILPVLGFSIDGLLAFGGVGGIVVGLAAKDFLSNIFGALSLHFDNQFVVGDWISISEKNLEGIVEEIGWKKVTIRTFDKRQVYIPNSLFSNFIIENPSRMTHRRIYEIMLLEPKAINDIPKIVKEIQDYLKTHPDVDENAGIVVHFNGFSQSIPTILVSAYIKQIAWNDYLRIREEILLKIHNILSLSEIGLYLTPQHNIQTI